MPEPVIGVVQQRGRVETVHTPPLSRLFFSFPLLVSSTSLFTHLRRRNTQAHRRMSRALFSYASSDHDYCYNKRSRVESSFSDNVRIQLYARRGVVGERTVQCSAIERWVPFIPPGDESVSRGIQSREPTFTLERATCTHLIPLIDSPDCVRAEQHKSLAVAERLNQKRLKHARGERKERCGAAEQREERDANDPARVNNCAGTFISILGGNNVPTNTCAAAEAMRSPAMTNR